MSLENIRIKIKEHWYRAGSTGKTVGAHVFTTEWWTPVLFDGDDEPEFYKTKGLEFLDKE